MPATEQPALPLGPCNLQAAALESHGGVQWGRRCVGRRCSGGVCGGCGAIPALEKAADDILLGGGGGAVKEVTPAMHRCRADNVLTSGCQSVGGGPWQGFHWPWGCYQEGPCWPGSKRRQVG